MTDGDKQIYIKRILDFYLALPDTPQRFSRHDRQLAQQLCENNINADAVENAMLLATLRRSRRKPDDPPLGPIRSMHYFRNVIQEVLQDPLPAGYAEYMRRSLAKAPK